MNVRKTNSTFAFRPGILSTSRFRRTNIDVGLVMTSISPAACVFTSWS